ncbi:agamous-like MADS-box protein AGL62 [Tanacetum coccineum]
MVPVNNMNKKTSHGHKKIEIKKIEENNNRQVTFSKRRNGLFKKAAELYVLTGAKIAIIVNSPGGCVFAFGHPNVDALINTYIANEKNVDVDGDMGESALPVNEFNQHYAEVSCELELEKRYKDMILKKSSSEFWFDEPIDGMDVADLAIIVNSPGGRVFAFGHPNVDALINTYLATQKNVDVDVDMGQSALPIK